MHDDSSPTEAGDAFGNANALAKGTRLFEFEIERVLGEGGFAIVYLAFDHSLHRRVALKEYLPTEFAFRQDENTILLRSVQHQKTFEAGRKSFVQEARFLAQFEHPSLVKVHRVFESNGTAYMVQGYYPGESLGAVLKAGRRYASDAELRPLVAALLAAVDLLHAHQCLHRDIAPDNIIIQPSGVPVLLDFGAARRIIGDMTQALTAVLKPSFAPIEQYTEDGGLAQGPWTDVYALAATLRMAITGKPPPSSVGRTIKDGLVKLADDPPPNFDLAFLRGIDAGLALLPAERPQTIAEFRAAMGIEADSDVTAPPTQEVRRTVERARAPAAEATAVTVPRTHVAVPPPPIRIQPVPPPPVAPPPVAPRPAPPRRRFKRSDAMLAVIAAAAVGLMLVVPFAADWIWPSPGSMPQPPNAREPRPAVPSPAPATPPSPVAPPSAAPVEKAPMATPVPSPAPSVATPAAPPSAAAAPKDVKPAAPPEKPAPSPAPPPAKVAEQRPPDPVPAPKQEPPPKPSPRDAAPAPNPSLIPTPAQPVAPAPTAAAAPAPAPSPREEPPPKPAAAPPQQTAALTPPDVSKIRRSLVRVAGEPPVYPREAIRAGIESGRVVALVTVDAQGNVADVDIVRSEPPRVFDRAARTALAGWRFKPEGERYQGEVDLRFNLKE